MTKSFKCVLFDLDGTLVSTGGAGIRALDRAFSRLYSLSEAMAEVDPAGKTDPAIIREIFHAKLGRDCSAEEMARAQEAYLSYLGGECERAQDYRVMSGIPEVLEGLLKLGAAVGLGTGNLEGGARCKLTRSGLNPFFPFGGFGSDAEERSELLKIGHRKASAHRGIDILRENVFIVGDTVRDIAAARRAGFKAIAVATGLTPLEALRKESPDFFLPNFEKKEEFVRIVFNGD